MIAFIMRRDGGICHCDVCIRDGLLKPAHEVDHIVPLKDNGDDDPSNLRAVNVDCHKRITAEQQGHRVRPTIGVDGFPVVD